MNRGFTLKGIFAMNPLILAIAVLVIAPMPPTPVSASNERKVVALSSSAAKFIADEAIVSPKRK